MRKQWWETFFEGTIGDFLFERISEEKTHREVDEIIRCTHMHPGQMVLDVACGRGRHSLELASRGYYVTGIDYSTHYIKDAEKLAKKRKLSANAIFVHGDMRKLHRQFSPGSFDVVVSLYNSFGYFDHREDDLRVLAEVSRILKPGGLFILNTLNRTGVEFRISELPAKAGLDSFYRWEQRGSSKEFLLDRAEYDADHKKLSVEWWFIGVLKKRAQLYSFKQNVYSPAELREMLAGKKMVVKKLWGQLDGERYSARSWHQTLIARKQP